MSYVLSDTTAPRLARFAREVFGVEEADNRKAAELGIQKVRAFNQSLEMPATLSESGVPEIERMEINYTFYFCLFEKSNKKRLT